MSWNYWIDCVIPLPMFSVLNWEQFIEEWGGLFQSTEPSIEPLILAGLVFTLIFLGLSFWNVLALIQYTHLPKTGGRASALAWAGWILSVLSPWMGPLLLIGSPLSVVFGTVAWFRIEDRAPRPTRLASGSLPIPLDPQRTRIPAKMAILNGFGTILCTALLLGGLYFTFGSLLREMFIDFWRNTELFREVIVT